LHLSVAAGIRSDSIARWVGSERVVRSMPNTPALVGRGMTALFARDAVTAATGSWSSRCSRRPAPPVGRRRAAARCRDGAVRLGPGLCLLFHRGDGAGRRRDGPAADKALQLAIGTFTGASELARASSEPPAVLRERVTSKGGTTYAALTSLQQDAVADKFVAAMHAACRARPNWATNSAATEALLQRVRGHDAGEHGEPDPVVQAEGAKAAVAAAVADQLPVPQRLRRGGGDAQDRTARPSSRGASATQIARKAA
jgi:hypothetical protein